MYHSHVTCAHKPLLPSCIPRRKFAARDRGWYTSRLALIHYVP